MQSRVRLAKPSSHLVQLLLASLPLLAVLLYFLYEAITRPSKPIYNLADDVIDDVVVKQAYADTGALIPLIELIPIFLIFEGLWLWLGIHCLLFIPKRRELMKYYLEAGEVCLGDVVYIEPGLVARIFCGGGNYASVEYTYPESRMWWIKKNVRVYERFSREKVSIVRLLNRPFSGQPKMDLEIDVQASSDSRSENQTLAAVSIAWAAFCLAGSTIICFQISKLKRDDYEDAQKAWRWLFAIGVIGLPVVITLGVFIRWIMYRHWIVNQGRLYMNEHDDDTGQAIAEENFQSMTWNEWFRKAPLCDKGSDTSCHGTYNEYSQSDRGLV